MDPIDFQCMDKKLKTKKDNKQTFISEHQIIILKVQCVHFSASSGEVANCNQRLSPPLTPPFRSTKRSYGGRYRTKMSLFETAESSQ